MTYNVDMLQLTLLIIPSTIMFLALLLSKREKRKKQKRLSEKNLQDMDLYAILRFYYEKQQRRGDFKRILKRSLKESKGATPYLRYIDDMLSRKQES